MRATASQIGHSENHILSTLLHILQCMTSSTILQFPYPNMICYIATHTCKDYRNLIKNSVGLAQLLLHECTSELGIHVI